MTTSRLLALVLTLVAGLAGTFAPQAAAQAPRAGTDYYEDDSALGFRVKYPRDWVFVPSQPGDPNLLGSYAPSGNAIVQISRSDWLALNYWLVKFDRRGQDDEPEVEEDEDGNKIIRIGPKPAKNVAEWLERSSSISIQQGGPWREVDRDERKQKGLTSFECEFRGELSEEGGLMIYALVVELRPDVEVAVLGIGPENNWRKYGPVYQKLARTFQELELKEYGQIASKAGDTPARSKKRRELIATMRNEPGWELYETENYFIVSNNEDKQFIKELMERLEAIRAVYEETYPAAEAEALIAKKRQLELEEKAKKKADAAAEKKESTPDGDGDDGDDGEEDEDEDEDEDVAGDRRTAAMTSSRDLSRTSVVRVCRDRLQYSHYGGPGGSAGYWSPGSQELVIFDDKEVGGRRNTWATLNHEAFHQFIFYFYGSIAPHSWYNEGTGDFYSGYQLKSGKFRLDKFDWRVPTIKTMLREDRYVPLHELVRYSQKEYYGTSKYGTSGGDHYAQGWSFIYFLRTGDGQTRCWNDDWNDILDVYLEALLLTEDHDEAVDRAFEGVDWDEIEECWKDYSK